MAAHKEEDERIILIRLILKVGRGHLVIELHGRGSFPAPASQFTALVIGHAPGSDVNQPGARILGQAFPRPLNSRRYQCLLNGILGGGKVAETADDRAEHLRREFAQQMLGTGVQRARRHWNSSGGPLITCRTSIGMFIGTPPSPGAADAPAAIS